MAKGGGEMFPRTEPRYLITNEKEGLTRFITSVTGLVIPGLRRLMPGDKSYKLFYLNFDYPDK
jgi:hypothetical protein